MDTPKKRGRPKSSGTLEKESIDKTLSEIPPNLKLTPKQAKEQDDLFQSYRGFLNDLYAQFSPTIPQTLVEEYASLNDESMYGYQQQILKKWAEVCKALEDGQRRGARETAKKATERAQAIWRENQDLAKRVLAGNLSVSGASKIISDQWDKRGDAEKKPTVRTISNWYKLK